MPTTAPSSSATVRRSRADCWRWPMPAKSTDSVVARLGRRSAEPRYRGLPVAIFSQRLPVVSVFAALAMLRPGPDVVAFHARTNVPLARHGIGMYIHAAIRPGANPGVPIQQKPMSAPFKSDMSPTPGRKTRATHDAGAEATCPADKESGARRRTHHVWIIVGHTVVARRDGQNLNVIGSGILHALILIVPQIAVVISCLPHALHGIHYVATLRQHGVAELLRPTHILRHVIQHLREGQQR